MHRPSRSSFTGWLALIGMWVAPATASAATYYVRATGNDANAGTSAAAAFRTIVKAGTRAQAGDTVYVGAGTYSGKVDFTYDGTAASPILFVADKAGTYTGDAGTVTATVGSGSVVFNIATDNYITLDGFVITGGTNGVSITGSTGALITRCTVQSTSSNGIHIATSSAKIDKTIVKDAGGNGIYCTGGSFQIVNCLIVDAGIAGVSTQALNLASHIWHTTIYSAGDEGITHNGGTLSVYNSIIMESADDGMERVSGTLNHNYNILYNNYGGHFDGITQSANELLVNPLFVSATDYHLQSTSPAVDKGTDLGVSEDLEGNPLPPGPPDIGAYGIAGGGGLPSHVYFVRITGNDNNSGTSKLQAFRTIGKAVSVVTAGKTVWVGAGAYAEAPSLVNKAGTNAQPIHFYADTDGAMTGDAGSVTVQGGFYLQNSSYVTLSSFTLAAGIRKASWSAHFAGVHLSGCSHVTLQSLVSSGGNYGFLVETSTGVNALACRAQTASIHGFCFQGATTGIVASGQANSNSQAGYYVAQGAVALTDCTSSGNGAFGFRYNAASGTLSSCTSTGDYLGAQLLGVNNDRNSVLATSLVIESSQNGAASLRVCTAQIQAGTQPLASSGPYGVLVDNARLTLNNAVIRDTQYGVQVIQGGIADLSNCSISNCTLDGVAATASTVTLIGSTLANCRDGVVGIGNSHVSAHSCTLSGHSGWGIKLSGRGSVVGCTLSNNFRGLSLTGQSSRGDVTVEETTIDNTHREALVAIRCTGNVSGATNFLSTAGSYGVYAEDSALTLSNFKLQGPEYGITAYGSQLTLSGGTISNALYDGIFLSDCQTTLSGCAIRTCRYGIRSEGGGLLLVDGSSLDTNSSWAILHTGYGTISNSTLTGNQRGLYLVGAVATGDITLTNTRVQGTVGEGLMLVRCSGNIPAGSDKISRGGSYGVHLDACDLVLTAPDILGPQTGILSYGSTLVLTDALVSGCATAAVHAVGGCLTAGNSTFSNSGQGLRADNADAVVLDHCLLSGNTAGLLATQNTSLTASNTTFTGNLQWGGSVNPQTSLGRTVVFSACTFQNNAGGLKLVNATDGQVALQAGTTLSGNTSSGLHFDGCNLTVNDQAGGTNWAATGNHYGISTYNSTLTLSNLRIQGGSSYGVYCEESVVSLLGCHVTGEHGVYADGSNDSLTIINSRFDAGRQTGWGLASYGGAVDVKNSIFNGYLNGALLVTSQGRQARLSNTTIANAGSYGVYVSQGDVAVCNTIIAGNGVNSVGLHDATGRLAHSHNLIHGFTFPYAGTSADATEVHTNPRFVDASQGDFHLAMGSPAINAGLDLGPGLVTDIEGNPRPSYRRYEIGAYEYTVKRGSLRILTWHEKQ